tara:strand:- start:242 stop:541 length:300 start_codon:yes stop_codon:yes gene_type:complete
MNTKQITKREAKKLILENRSSIFSVLFTKKDGSKRSMNARLDVKSKLKGGELKYNPANFNHIIAYDMIKNNYRTININTLERLKLNKQEYDIIAEKLPF